MNIQSYIDRKRIAGAREHEGNKTDWAGWDICDLRNAIVGELLDACAYCERVIEVVQKTKIRSSYETRSALEAVDMVAYLKDALEQFDESNLEAACQEAEQEVEAGEVTGKPYAELEAELAEAKRRAAWYLDTSGYCNNCTDMFTRGDKEPCISCKYHDGDKDNFTPAPVPDDFEVAENDIYD